MTAIEAIAKIEGTTNAAFLFGSDPDQVYRDLAKLIHPDIVDAKLIVRAREAFVKLGRLRSTLNGKSIPSATIIGKWIVEEKMATGDIAELYYATHLERPEEKAIFKIARSPKDGDLMENENFSLKYLHADKEGGSFKRYLPPLLGTLEASGRRANILGCATDTMPLSEILRLVPRLEFRHLVWMVNRSLSVLGFAHKCGIVHGAILPEHLLFGPESHALTLVDWCYSVTGESLRHIPALVKTHADLYPAEVARKQAALPATDIYMLFATMKATGVLIPKRFRALFEWCTVASPRARPSDAWQLQDRWLALAREEFGPPAYVKLEIPLT